jgi:hypothetical protein
MCQGRPDCHQDIRRYQWVNVTGINSGEVHRQQLRDIIDNLKERSTSRVISPPHTHRSQRLRTLTPCPRPPDKKHLWKIVQSTYMSVDRLEEATRAPRIIPDLILARLKTVRRALLEIPQNETPQLQQVDWWGQPIPKTRSSGPRQIHISAHVSGLEPSPYGLHIHAPKYRYRSPEHCNSRPISREKSPERSLSRERSPERSLSRERSPERSLSCEKSPERSLSRDTSPEPNEYRVQDTDNGIRLILSNKNSVALQPGLKPSAKTLPTIHRTRTSAVKTSVPVQLAKRPSLDIRRLVSNTTDPTSFTPLTTTTPRASSTPLATIVKTNIQVQPTKRSSLDIRRLVSNTTNPRSFMERMVKPRPALTI